MSMKIDIVAARKAGGGKVKAKGDITEVMPDSESRSWGLDSYNLKRSVAKYFGKWPNDTYFKGPTPWGDLYTRYGWPPVSRKMRILATDIVNEESKPVIVKEDTLRNASSVPATFDASISETLTNTVENKISTGGALTIGGSVEVGVNFGAEAKATSKLEYTQSWGIEQKKTQQVRVSSTSGLSVNLEPGQAVKAVLQANRGSMRVKVVYEASIFGWAALNYNPPYKGHHFWGMDVRCIFMASNSRTTKRFVEYIDIDYYSEGQVVLKDANTGKTVMRSACLVTSS